MIYPKHIWLIPDGNRTWAESKWIPKVMGHMEWFNKCVELSKYIFTNTDVEVFTVWWLSTENFRKRSEDELEYLFELYKKIPSDLYEFLSENKINFKIVGDMSSLPSDLSSFLKEKQEEFTFYSKKSMVLAINYWWRDEIIRWIKDLFQNSTNINDISEENLSKYLDFWSLPNIDLVVRTKWDLAKRLSWFMLWWAWYAELYFSKKKLPEFSIDDLNDALNWFDSINSNRNFGK